MTERRPSQYRIARDLLVAIPAAMARRDAFLERVKQASTRDACAALMAEAIDMHIAANSLEVIGRDGRVLVRIEDMAASHCLKAAREAYAAHVNAPNA